MAAAAGIDLTWEDFDDLSAAVPSVARIYPNGPADVNHFHAAGGTPFLVAHAARRRAAPRGRADPGRPGPAPLHARAGAGRRRARVRRRAPPQSRRPRRPAPGHRPVRRRRRPAGAARHAGPRGHQGLRGRRRAPRGRGARRGCSPTRSASSQAFSRRELDRDVVVVIREQGPVANGMPELHALTPSLGVLQKRGYAVALVTDGRMSGASGAIPAAIHVTPESVHAGPISKIQDGDVIRRRLRPPAGSTCSWTTAELRPLGCPRRGSPTTASAPGASCSPACAPPWLGPTRAPTCSPPRPPDDRAAAPSPAEETR